ncbi:MAG: histidinol-phosphate transaminase [bacterium]
MTSETEKIASIIKLSQNENPFGASPLALKAIKTNYHSIYRYPEVTHKALKSKLAEKYNILPDNVVVSAGSVELIDMAIKSFVGVDENIVIGEITFVAYGLSAKINRRLYRRAKLVDNTIDIGNVISLCDDKTKVVIIANPNNPTGTIISHNSLRKLLQTLPSNIFVVIDEAYAEYVTDPAYPDSFALQKTFPNLIIFRTFSKIYGLAGLRIGYAIAHPDVIKPLSQSRNPFSVNSLAAAAALAALDDTEYVKKCASINEKERAFLYKELRRMGFKVIPSHGNFIFVEFSKPEEKEKVYDQLKNAGVLVRKLGPFGTETGLRMSVGRPEENRHLVNSLKQVKL